MDEVVPDVVDEVEVVAVEGGGFELVVSDVCVGVPVQPASRTTRPMATSAFDTWGRCPAPGIRIVGGDVGKPHGGPKRSLHAVRIAGLCIVMLLCLPTAASDSPEALHASFTSLGTARISGPSHLTWHVASANADPILTNLTASFRFTDAHLQVVDYPTEYLWFGGSPGPAPSTFTTPLPRSGSTVLTDQRISGRMALSDLQPFHMATLQGGPGGMAVNTTNADTMLTRPVRTPDSIIQDRLFEIRGSNAGFPLEPPPGRVAAASARLDEFGVADARLVLFGASLRGDDGTYVATGTFVDSNASTQGPQGTAGHAVYRNLVATLTGNVTVELRGPDWGLAVDTMTGLDVTDIEIQNVQGNLQLGGDRHEVRATLFQAQGNFSFEAIPGLDGQATQWNITGAATFVAIDGATTYGLRGSRAAVLIVSAATGASVVVGLAFLYHRAKPLASHRRRQIMDVVTDNPGLDAKEIMAKLGLRRTTARFHLGVLLRNHLIDEIPAGGRHHYFLNDGSARFRPAENAGLAGEAMAIALHPVANDVCNALRAAGRPLALRDVVGALTQPRSRQVVRYQLKRLERVGVVQEVAGGFALAVDPANLRKTYENRTARSAVGKKPGYD